MGKKDPRVDVYIAKSADFARPILKHIRKVVHAGCPDVEEDTRQRRMETAVEWMAEGKPRHWKYARK